MLPQISMLQGALLDVLIWKGIRNWLSYILDSEQELMNQRGQAERMRPMTGDGQLSRANASLVPNQLQARRLRRIISRVSQGPTQQL